MAFKSLTLAAGLGAVMAFGGCGAVSNDAAGRDAGASGGTESTSGGSASIGLGGSGKGGSGKGGSGKGGAAGQAQGGAATNHCQTTRDEAPGAPVYEDTASGAGECADTTLAEVISRIQQLRPDLADVTTLSRPDPEQGGDGSFIYAFQRADGGFAVVLQRGSGDCPSGCPVKDYWYFETGAACEVAEVGEAHRQAGQCMQADQLPRWGIPAVALPSEICGADLSPQNLTGVYALTTCGQLDSCSTGKTPATSAALPSAIELTIQQQHDDLSRGQVTLQGTGEPLLDGVAFDATFERRKVKVEARSPELPSNCIETWNFNFDYDFEGLEARQLYLHFVHTPECESAPDAYCKGQVSADFGETFRTGAACTVLDCAALDEAECSARAATDMVSGCVPRYGRLWPAGVETYAGCAPTCCTVMDECPGNSDAEVCAADPDKACWMLSSPPVPSGWTLLVEDSCEFSPACSNGP
jgi:hypothetical protein